MSKYTNKNIFSSKIFYEFTDIMLFLITSRNNEHLQLKQDLYKIIYSTSEELFSIINTSIGLNKTIKQRIEEDLKSSRAQINNAIENYESTGDEDEDEYKNVIIARMVSIREDDFRLMERELEIHSISSIVMLLSLLESTLFECISKLNNYDDSKFPEVKTVLKRDKGVVKYLKYFEDFMSTKEKYQIVGKPIYNKLLMWAELRNNIVHNFNRYNETTFKGAKKNNIEIEINNMYNKFKFSAISVVQLGELVSEILYSCIKEFFYRFFNEEFLEVNGYYSPIIID